MDVRGRAARPTGLALPGTGWQRLAALAVLGLFVNVLVFGSSRTSVAAPQRVVRDVAAAGAATAAGATGGARTAGERLAQRQESEPSAARRAELAASAGEVDSRPAGGDPGAHKGPPEPRHQAAVQASGVTDGAASSADAEQPAAQDWEVSPESLEALVTALEQLPEDRAAGADAGPAYTQTVLESLKASAAEARAPAVEAERDALQLGERMRQQLNLTDWPDAGALEAAGPSGTPLGGGVGSRRGRWVDEFGLVGLSDDAELVEPGKDVPLPGVLQELDEALDLDACDDDPLPVPPSTPECLDWRHVQAVMATSRAKLKRLRRMRALAPLLDAAAERRLPARRVLQAGGEAAAAVHTVAALKPPPRLAGSAEVCGQILGIQKVALLFLIVKQIPHQTLWNEWLTAAADLIPKEQAAAFGCSELHLEVLRRYCRSSPSDNPYSRQFLFSIYVHALPEYEPDFPEDSIFHGRMVPCRTAADWGNLGDATKALVQAALEDPLNQRFLLTSDSDMPLYPAPALWLQLMHEHTSRVDACNADQVKTLRLHDDWGRLTVSPLLFAGRVKPEHWRKSSQWAMLVRRHAELMIEDFEVEAAFRRHCYVGRDARRCRRVFCPADEYYLATMLNFYNESGSCACASGLRGGGLGTPTFAWWQNGEAHPHSYRSFEVREELFDEMRLADCSEEAISHLSASAAAFATTADTWTVRGCAAPIPKPDVLPQTCLLLARKFKERTQYKLLKAARSCKSRVQLLNLPC